MSELKPCPFCDGESVSIRMVRLNRRSGYRASCNGCGTTQGGIVHPSIEAAKEAWNRRAEPEQQAEPVAAPAGYFCEPYLNKPGLFEQVFNGFDDPDVIPLYRDPNGRIAALEREVERLKEQQFTDLCNSADVKRLISVVAYPDNYADQNFSEMAKRVLAKMEQNVKALAGGEA